MRTLLLFKGQNMRTGGGGVKIGKFWGRSLWMAHSLWTPAKWYQFLTNAPAYLTLSHSLAKLTAWSALANPNLCCGRQFWVLKK